MKRYEKFADAIAELIRSGVLGAGQRVPSVRYASQTYGVSPSTVFQAYYLLERRGLIRARPRSGYFVNTHAPSPLAEPLTMEPVRDSTEVDVSELVFSVLDSIKDPNTVPFGSAFPSPLLFPLPRLARSLARAARDMDRAWWSPTCHPATRNCAGRSPCAIALAGLRYRWKNC